MDFRHRGAFPKENYWRATDPKRAVVTDVLRGAPAERKVRAVILRGYIAGEHSERSPPSELLKLKRHCMLHLHIHATLYIYDISTQSLWQFIMPPIARKFYSCDCKATAKLIYQQQK